MYRFKLSTQAAQQFESLTRGAKHQGKIIEVLEEVVDDPFKRAKETGIPILGKYYINTGSFYCALIEIDETNQTIDVLQVIPQSKLYNIIRVNKN